MTKKKKEEKRTTRPAARSHHQVLENKEKKGKAEPGRIICVGSEWKEELANGQKNKKAGDCGLHSHTMPDHRGGKKKKTIPTAVYTRGLKTEGEGTLKNQTKKKIQQGTKPGTSASYKKGNPVQNARFNRVQLAP